MNTKENTQSELATLIAEAKKARGNKKYSAEEIEAIRQKTAGIFERYEADLKRKWAEEDEKRRYEDYLYR